ncbi:hypothetical protein HanIR_Chr12g0582301 [Helianthus annuus]|nr:hypothetical protein HanIR_Chr12g0582301 [Helianthus annuus]
MPPTPAVIIIDITSDQGGPTSSQRWAGAPLGKKFNVIFRRKFRSHPLDFSSAHLR